MLSKLLQHCLIRFSDRISEGLEITRRLNIYLEMIKITILSDIQWIY